jgi:MYXO-CTERM domain-containing protein
MKALALLTVIAAALVIAPSARAWSPIDGSRPVWCGPAPYSMNNAGSADLGGMSEAEVRRGMDAWTTVACSGLRTNYRGQVPNTPGSYEGTSTIGWIESGWRHDARAIGVTGPSWSFGGGEACIQEADMELNGFNYTWITGSGRGSSVNTFSIVLHEGGHYYGIGHSSDPGAAMYGAYSGGISSITGDDEDAICSLYPGTGVDCTTTGCPAGFECVGGSCEAIVGDGMFCSPCSSNDECGGEADLCVGYPDGARYCGVSCFSDGDCPGSDAICAPLRSGGRQCARRVGDEFTCAGAMPMGCRNDSECGATERCNIASGACEPRPVDLGELGAACGAGTECNSGNCFVTPAGGVCSQTCDWLDVASCPSGFYCNSLATGACGTGVCLAGAAGAAPDGDACSDATECASLFCFDGTCGRPCVPGETDTCAGGSTCRTGTVVGCGVCKMAAGLGEVCIDNLDCSTRFCAQEGDRRYCTDVCNDANPCPTGFECLNAGTVDVCAPPLTDTGDRRDGCGCSTSRGGGASVVLAGIVLAVFAALRRRRKPARRD